jgi:hypothetical protein
MSFYSDLADTASELIAEFGQVAIVTNLGIAIEDPLTGVANRESSTFTTVGVLLDYDYRNFGDTTQSYKATSQTDKRVILKGTGVVNAGDLITIGGFDYTANVVKTVSPASIVVIYDVWIQK